MRCIDECDHLLGPPIRIPPSPSTKELPRSLIMASSASLVAFPFIVVCGSSVGVYQRKLESRRMPLLAGATVQVGCVSDKQGHMHGHMPLERSLFVVEGDVHVKVSETSVIVISEPCESRQCSCGPRSGLPLGDPYTGVLFLQRETYSGPGSAIHVHNFHLSVLRSMRLHEIGWSVERFPTSMAQIRSVLQGI